MNKKQLQILLSAALAALAFSSLLSQEEAGIKWSGYVKVDLFNDSRAVIAARDDMYMFYPAERKQITKVPGTLTLPPDQQDLYILSNTEDLNAVRQTSITAVQTRLIGNITGPEAFGAKVTGLVEVDFFGTGNSLPYMTRLRHAYVTLNWGAQRLLAGQAWHPLFVAGYQPDTVQLSPLSPIHPFARAPQVRYYLDVGGGLNVNIAAIYRAYHSDTGPTSSVTASDATPNYNSRFKRWADRPDIDLQLEYKSDVISGGITIDLTTLRPYDNQPNYNTDVDAQKNPLVTADTVGNNKNQVRGISYQLFGKFIYDKDNRGEVRFNYVVGENTHHLLMLGGYAEKANFILDNLTALGISATDAKIITTFTKKEYTPIKVVSYWIQPMWGKDITYSIVLGRSENKGAKEDVKKFYSRGSNIKTVTSIIPQVMIRSGKTVLGFMLGYFEAEYKEDDQRYQRVVQYINSQAGIAGPDYTTIKIGGFTIPNPSVMDSKGVIGDTYKVVDYRLQASITQNF